MERILVSACLLGRPVAYDGSARRQDDPLFERWRTQGRLVPYCPEVGGGLPVPRPAAEISDGLGGAAVLDGRALVVTADGGDVTPYFLAGARRALETALRYGVRTAILKERSPSCGVNGVYDGTFRGRAIPGSGVTTALLEREGVRVFSEDEFDAVADRLRELESPG